MPSWAQTCIPSATSGHVSHVTTCQGTCAWSHCRMCGHMGRLTTANTGQLNCQRRQMYLKVNKLPPEAARRFEKLYLEARYSLDRCEGALAVSLALYEQVWAPEHGRSACATDRRAVAAPLLLLPAASCCPVPDMHDTKAGCEGLPLLHPLPQLPLKALRQYCIMLHLAPSTNAGSCPSAP